MKTLMIIFCSFQILLNCHTYGYQTNIEGKFRKNYNQSPFIEHRPKKDSTIEGIGKLTTSLLDEIYNRAGKNFNIVFSPFSIWSVLALLLEGAGGKTEDELKSKLNAFYFNHEDGRKIIRSRYQDINKSFQETSGPTEYLSLNFVVSDKKLNPDFEKILYQYYDGKYFNFVHRKKGLFSIMVNSWALDKSNGKINTLISPTMLNNLVLLIGNAVYFKSKWKIPFDPSDTLSLPFKNEFGNVTGNTLMMNLAAVLPVSYNPELESQIIEIPYADNRTSMIVILPKPKVSLKTVLVRMKNRSLKEIIPNSMTEETVQLSLPRFYVTSKMYLNDILKQDLPSMFDSRKAEFPHLGKNIFVSKIFHKAQIENTEEGTTASAISSIQFAYKTGPAVFRADRPFIYFINDIKTRTIIFAGTFSKPATANS